MTAFTYRVQREDGDVQAGVVDASDRDAAFQALSERGYTILLLEKKHEAAFLSLSTLSFFNQIKPKDLIVVSRVLSVMVSASVPLVEAIRNVAQQSDNPRVVSMMTDVANEVDGGARFSDALQKYGSVFGDFYINMVHSGETSGQLTDVLEYLADQLEKDYDLHSKISGAMIYPGFILTGLVVVGFVMMTFVVPKLTSILQDANIPLPLSTRLLIGASSIFEYHWVLILCVCVGGIAGFRTWISTPVGRLGWDGFKMRIPLFGGLLKRMYVVRFARSLATLNRGGVDMVTALEIVSGVIGNARWKQLVFDTVQEVNDGNSIVTAMQRTTFVPPMMIQMLGVGEETGRTQEVLQRLSTFFSREIDNIVANMVSLIEPIVMVLLGLGVGIMVSAILLPLYSLSSAV